MKRITAEYFEAFEVKGDGGGVHSTELPLGKFKEESDAQAVAKGRGMYSGQDGSVKKGTLNVVIFDSIAEYEEDKLSKIRERALGKLTEEERKALGL